ncbi:hypothetical protein DFP72DRAFT_294041 [Ephemerocybe angulata]|uniref:F-box domain-containing protein n=1 Tax=Ephemerocybe angulata TaxID=980116 RepID=A0A8H6HZW7_9AGAR|nr:hypothetical protein DFP72DRAFT_294041 [Tulosesus angulatus]
MRSLAPELQLEIIGELDECDIAQLEQVCKDLYDLIEGNPDAWKGCLRRKCEHEGMIWSSFSNLSTAAGFKAACTGPKRFKRKCDQDQINPVKVTTPFSTVNADVPGNASGNERAASDEPNPWTDLRDIYLVPGGRFLITIEGSWMKVWDLILRGEDGSPTLLRRHSLAFKKYLRLICVEVVNTSTLHLLLCEDFPDTSAGWNMAQNRSRSVLEVFEFKFSVSVEEAFLVRKLAELGVRHNGWYSPLVTQLRGLVALKTDRDTLVWDYNQGGYYVWRALDEDGGICTTSRILILEGYVIYLDYQWGFHGARILDHTFHPLGNAREIDILTQHGIENRAHSLSIRYARVPKSLTKWHVTQYANDQDTIVYEQQEEELVFNTTFFHRFSFQIDSDNPQESEFIPEGRYSYKPSVKYAAPHPFNRFPSGQETAGVVWFAWDDGMTISVHPSLTERCPSPEKTITRARLLPKRRMTDTAHRIAVSPVSGKIAILWRRTTCPEIEIEDTFLEILDIFP